MEELLQLVKNTVSQAQSVCSAMQNAINYAKNITKEAEVKIKVADDKEALNIQKSNDITIREKEVAKIENIVAVNEENKALLKEAKENIAKLEKMQTDFAEEKRKSLQDIGSKSAKVVGDNQMLDREWVILKKAQEQLKVDKEKMRENILKELKSIK